MLTELFEYRFASSLTGAVTHELHVLTGMLIGDVANPQKDTPGSGRFAGAAHLALERGEEPEEWYLSAFTHDLVSTDLTEIALLRAQLQIVLKALTQDVQELLVSPALPPVSMPTNAAGLVMEGDALARAGRYDRAVVDYTCALARTPTDAHLVAKRAVCLRGLGRIDDALADRVVSQERGTHDIHDHSTPG